MTLAMIVLCATMCRGHYGIDFIEGSPETDAIRFWKNPEKTECVEVNYDESKAGELGKDYELPELLAFADGRKVNTPEDWKLRRKEILGIFEREMYGKMPPKPDVVEVEMVSDKLSDDRFSRRRTYRMWFRKDRSGPYIDWFVAVPVHIRRRVPVVVHLNYNGNDTVAKGNTNHYALPLETMIARGYAFMSAHYQQVTADPRSREAFKDVFNGVYELWGGFDERRGDETGALMAWAWALCRGIDLAERIPEVDAKRNVVIGSSRLGKAALLAGAFDERVAVTVPNQTGAVGVQIMRRNYGETLETQRLSFPHWYCPGAWKYVGHPERQPFDQHMLLACVAPRALLLECYHKRWFDPKGEFIAAKAASPAWELHGLPGLRCGDDMPAAYDDCAAKPPFGYVRRTECHGLSPYDWQWALDFADKAWEKVASLPDEYGATPPIDTFPFPDRLSAYVWRNWGLVPTDRLAAVVGATVADLQSIAGEMGLAPDPDVLQEWDKKGYITIVRRNWHLLPYDQIIRLVGMTRDRFAFVLKEEDFLFSKMGLMKPACELLVWSREAADAGREGRGRIAAALMAEGVNPSAAEEPRFAFVKELMATDASAASHPQKGASAMGKFNFRMIASYFADYGDPLSDDEIGSFPDGLLQKLAADGVNAVWMHVVLNTLVKDPKYPEFGVGSERRVANLKKLVARAAKYGIKVYLYLNEPRCVTAEFFEKEGREGMRGVSNAGKGTVALCTSSPETLRWLRDSLTSLFSQVKGLGGAFTITMSENLTNCASNRNKDDCPRCRNRSVADILLEVNRTIAEGIAAGDPGAELIVWNWSWPEGVEKEVLPRLPKRNCRVMHVSENGIPVTVGGATVELHDYSIAIVGPGERAKAFWAEAKRCGLPVVAKVQACCSWELSSFPYIPAMDLVAEHARNLEREGVRGVMLSWSCGSAPAANLRLFGGDTLDDIALDLYGEKAAPQARKAWTAFSNGFRRYPFDVVVAYKGPQQWGPANPLYRKPTGYQATMVGMPYDGLDFGKWDNKWNGRFPVGPWLERFQEVSQGFAEGCRLFAAVVPLVDDPAKRAAAERELAMFRAEAMHFRSLVDQSRFILARNAGDRQGMRDLALRELATAKEYLPLVRGDSRIGYECTNHYFYVPRDVCEKIALCRMIADEKDSN